mgnify:FL=1
MNSCVHYERQRIFTKVKHRYCMDPQSRKRINHVAYVVSTGKQGSYKF